ncbi:MULTISPECIES: hypothetical protein [Bradyrhizobium]|uniref:hypothetical protein n=1 Tax=Bradyrhizobium TaxID=374 RepID=UPI001EDBF756|nr:hypothetical protein [Bradyrhizobium zhengyangense]MCG2645738.1 hypothetical protein [Bradyrhizobium zhengyangense]
MISRIFVIVGFAVLFVCCPCGKAGAVTAEIAKKCEAAVVAAFPPRVPSNPTAGSAKGNVRDQRAYFNECVKNGGAPPSDKK